MVVRSTKFRLSLLALLFFSLNSWGDLRDPIFWITGNPYVSNVGMLLAVELGSSLALGPPPKALGKHALAAGSAIQPKGGSPIALTDGTPVLPFLGNTLAQGLVYNGGTLYPTLLLRQSDCSLTEFVTSTSGLTPTVPGLAASLTNAQDYLHQIAQLGTVPDKFAKGCADPVLGVPARVMEYVGKSSNGTYLFADAGITSDNLIVYRIAPNFTRAAQTLATNVGGKVAVADVDNDGFNDIIATGIADPKTGTTGVGVFLSNHDGTFKAPVVYPVAGAFHLTVDDVDGDGKPDILVAGLPSFDAGSQALTTLIGQGNGSFIVGPSANTGVVAQGTILTGNFSGRGKKDAIVGNILMKGNGDGSFTPAPGLLPFGSFGTLVTGDFNGDGKPDVVAPTSSWRISAIAPPAHREPCMSTWATPMAASPRRLRRRCRARQRPRSTSRRSRSPT